MKFILDYRLFVTMFFQPDLYRIISYELGCNDCSTLSFGVHASFVAISMLVIAHS